MKLFVNDLTVMDFSYLCPERGMVGESWIVDVVLDGGLNEESMVQDFGIVKKQLKRLIDDYVDHKLVVPMESKNTVSHAASSDGRVQLDFSFVGNKAIQLLCPPEAYAFVYSEQITKTSVTEYLKDVIATHLPENVHDIEITLREELIAGPYYHYTHGLKKHDGNCQRIAHGHRSKILIEHEGEYSDKWQRFWAERWSDIYIGSKEDIVEASSLNFTLITDESDCICFKYEASQGMFEMAIAKDICEVVDYDSTVECLAQFIFEETSQNTEGSLRVRAFEGVGKGAIVCSD